MWKDNLKTMRLERVGGLGKNVRTVGWEKYNKAKPLWHSVGHKGIGCVTLLVLLLLVLSVYDTSMIISLSIFSIIYLYLFIWLNWVLVAACGI